MQLHKIDTVCRYSFNPLYEYKITGEISCTKNKSPLMSTKVSTSLRGHKYTILSTEISFWIYATTTSSLVKCFRYLNELQVTKRNMTS